jgi:hypothetical protein
LLLPGTFPVDFAPGRGRNNGHAHSNNFDAKPDRQPDTADPADDTGSIAHPQPAYGNLDLHPNDLGLAILHAQLDSLGNFLPAAHLHQHHSTIHYAEQYATTAYANLYQHHAANRHARTANRHIYTL